MKSDKATFWQSHIDAWQTSDLSQIAYCHAHELKLSSFSYWRKHTRSKGQSAFVSVGTANGNGLVSISLPAGLRIDLPAALLAQALPIILKAVNESASC